MARVLRDRQIALAFLRKGESKEARAEIARETGINLRTIYRAIERQADWARNHLKSEAPAADTDAGQAGPKPNAPQTSVQHEEKKAA